MTIESMAALPRSQAADAAAPAAGSAGNVDENEFLQLLVAQIQYQDPTNPTDSTAFVTQLAQFSSLEQLIAIHGDLDGLTQSGASGTQETTTQGGN